MCALAGAAAVLWFLGGRALVAEGVYPLEKTVPWFRRHVTCRLRTLWTRQSLAASMQSLRRENEALRMRLAEIDRERAGTGEPAKQLSENWIPADVLSRGGATGAKNFIRLNRGSFDGVTKGAPVSVPEGLVGRVTEVSAHTSVVTFITDPAVRVSCEIETADDSLGAVYGIVSGTGMRTVGRAEAVVLYVINPLRARHLRAGFTPPPQTKVVTSGLGGVFPKGLTVGFLRDDVHADETGLEHEGTLVPAVDFPSLERVFIRREN